SAEKLVQYDWPGNVRELRNKMDQVAVLARSEAVAGHEIDFAPARIAAFQGSELASLPAAAVDDSTAVESEPEAELPLVFGKEEPDDDDHPMIVRVTIGTTMAEVERLLI